MSKVFLAALLLMPACFTTENPPYDVDIEYREKEVSRNPRLGSVLVFPASGKVDSEGKINQAIQKEIFVQLGKTAYSVDYLEQIFISLNIPQLFPISLHSQMSYFDQILKQPDLPNITGLGKIRYPGLEFQFSKKIDIHLAVKKLALQERNLEAFTDAISALDFPTTYELFKSYPGIWSDINMLIYSAERKAGPRYLMFSRFEGDEVSYKNGAPLSLTSLIVNFETGAVRVVGRIKSETYSENKMSFLSQVRNMTALLIRHGDYRSRQKAENKPKS
jgi:hypothetical protein